MQALMTVCAVLTIWFLAQKRPDTARCRVFSFALLACHHPAGATLPTWFLLTVCRILLHPLLVALHICLRCRCAIFFLCASSEQSGSDDDGEANGDMFHICHYSGRFALVSLMHPTLDGVSPDIGVTVVRSEREVPRDQHVCRKHKNRLLF